MRTHLLVIVLLAFPLLAAATAQATPSETEPDCEEGQWWLGGRSTKPVMDAYASLGAPGGIHPCDGEHWDGQDPVEDTAAPCSGVAEAGPDGVHAGFCQDADPNAGSSNDLVDPLGARASASADGAAYASVNVAYVARAAVYADDSMVALYYRDNTPTNMVVTAVNSWRIVYYVSEQDCDHATYHAGVKQPPGYCTSDNTAITLEHGLLP